MTRRLIDFSVGLFMVAGALAMLALAFHVSGLKRLSPTEYYHISADFDNIGSLKPRSPVRIAGVKVGQVEDIILDTKEFRAKVIMSINKHNNNLPVDTSAKILTEGLLGSNYISLVPGFEEELLSNGDVVETTHPAIILENLIGQLVFNVKNGDKEKKE